MSIKVNDHIVVNGTGLYEVCKADYGKYYAKLIGEGKTIPYVFDNLEVLYGFFSQKYQNDFRILRNS